MDVGFCCNLTFYDVSEGGGGALGVGFRDPGLRIILPTTVT